MKHKRQAAALPPKRAVQNNVLQEPRGIRLEQWLARYPLRVLVMLVVLWSILRVAVFVAVAHGPLYRMYEWKESDSYFFDAWARSLAGGDWLNSKPLHPYHGWHQQTADAYFRQHPDKLNAIRAAQGDQVAPLEPGKLLWNEWYGGNTFHQEPLYAYVLALCYWLTGNGVYSMLVLQGLLGLASGGLLWRIARRHFGETVALLTGLLYLFCGIVLFQETLVLRSAWSVFFALLSVWTLDRALDQQSRLAFWQHGAALGLAGLLQSTFLLFVPLSLILYGWRKRRPDQHSIRNAGSMVLAVSLILSPVLLRNYLVGAPLFSMSSVGPITFVAANLYETKTIAHWEPDVQRCGAILGQSGGIFSTAALATWQTHPSVGTWLALSWQKFLRIWDGTEWPNNENYYFYRAMAPALRFAFADFYWIAWAAVAGVLFSIFSRRKCPALWSAIALQIGILVGFYVLGRLRTPLVVLLLPFAAFALVECWCKWSANKRVALAHIGIAALCWYFLAWKPFRPAATRLDPTDYTVLYDLVYKERVLHLATAQAWTEAAALHAEFLQNEPAMIQDLRSGQRLSSPGAVALTRLFAYHFQMQSDLYSNSGKAGLAAAAQARGIELERIAQSAGR
ncbi:MAG: glycosyltransferase family 39 protein [Saprospiraceae bacterium]|nr:glycosyltransferase family 39 protein [Saprospiraceae bacterium]